MCRMRRWSIPALTAVFAAAAILAGSSSAPAAPDEYVFLQEAEAGSLDPFRDFSVAGLGIHAHVFDPLVDMEGQELQLKPKLAVSWEVVDPVTWRFSIRRGVRFHDGQELTAEDVKFTLETANDARSVKRTQVATIESVTVLDRFAIEIRTRHPDAALLSRLAFVYVVSKAAYVRDPESFGRKPVGTGRYRVVRWDKDQQLVLEAFEDYWDRKPSVRRLIVKPVREATTRLAELQTGRAHVIKGVPVEVAKRFGQSGSGRIIVSKGVRQVYFTLNALRPPFHDVRVRQALNYAIDRDAIVKHILEGFGEVRTGPFSPRQWGYSTDVRGYTYDPERARRLLREAGHAKGLDVTWDLAQGWVVKGVEIAEAIANQLAQVGVRVKLNVIEGSALLEKRNAGNFDMAVTTWSRQADPDSLVTGLRYHSSVNKWYRDERVDALIDESRLTLDPGKRLKVYQSLHRALVESAPQIFTHAQDEIFGVRKDVQWTPFPFGGNAGMVYFVPME